MKITLILQNTLKIIWLKMWNCSDPDDQKKTMIPKERIDKETPGDLLKKKDLGIKEKTKRAFFEDRRDQV